jgi:hypothetical protein
MNPNALNQKRNEKTKTETGKSRCGFRKTDGVIMSKEVYYAELKKNGYKIEKLKNGILISK